jgi:hypothetical protein
MNNAGNSQVAFEQGAEAESWKETGHILVAQVCIRCRGHHALYDLKQRYQVDNLICCGFSGLTMPEPWPTQRQG